MLNGGFLSTITASTTQQNNIEVLTTSGVLGGTNNGRTTTYTGTVSIAASAFLDMGIAGFTNNGQTVGQVRFTNTISGGGGVRIQTGKDENVNARHAVLRLVGDNSYAGGTFINRNNSTGRPTWNWATTMLWGRER